MACVTSFSIYMVHLHLLICAQHQAAGLSQAILTDTYPCGRNSAAVCCQKLLSPRSLSTFLFVSQWNAKYVATSFCNHGSFGDRLCMLLLLDAWVYRSMHVWTDGWLGDLGKYKQLRYE